MSSDETSVSESATLIVTAYLAGEIDQMSNAVVDLADNPGVAGKVTMALAILAGTVLQVLQQETGADPFKVIQSCAPAMREI